MCLSPSLQTVLIGPRSMLWRSDGGLVAEYEVNIVLTEVIGAGQRLTCDQFT